MSALLKILTTSFRQAIAYRFNMFLYSVGTMFQILVMVAIWTVLRDSGQLTGPMTYSQLVSFSLLTFSMGSLFSIFGAFFFLTDKIKKGDIVLELIRPVNFLFHLLFRNLGGTLFRLLFIFIPFLVFGYFFLGLEFPAGPLSVAAALSTAILGYLINFLIWFLFGLLSFFSLDNMGTLLLFMSLNTFLSGRAVPLDYYPEFLQGLLRILPFRSIFYEPVGFYLGTIPLERLAEILLFQSLWILGLSAVAALAWSGISRRLIIQGG